MRARTMEIPMVDLTSPELDYLETLLARRHDELLHELHHAVSQEYKEGLKRQVGLTEELRAKLAAEERRACRSFSTSLSR